MSAPIDIKVWDEIVYESELFDKNIEAAPENEDSDIILLCLHSWVYLGEAGDPEKRDFIDDRIRKKKLVWQKVEDACQDGLTEKFATFVGKIALSNLHICKLLDADNYRNEITLLANCFGLEGDLFTAASVLNSRQTGFAKKDVSEFTNVLSYSGKLKIAENTYIWDNGKRNGEFTDEAIFEILLEDFDDISFYRETIIGIDDKYAKSIGTVYIDKYDGDDTITMSSPYEIIWFGQRDHMRMIDIKITGFSKTKE